MKTKLFAILALTGLSTLDSQLSSAPLGTAFTYQGRFTQGGVAYTGNAEFQPTLWNAASGGSQVAANSPAALVVGVTNGLFELPLDFGGGVFIGEARWLQLEVRTTLGPFILLEPRQPLMPTPQALYAANAQLLNGQASTAYLLKSGDTMTGPLNLPANGLVAGTSQLVLSGGNVGIGKTGPAAKLDVAGTVKAESFAGSGAGLILSGTYSSAVTFNNSANSFSGNGAGLLNVNADRLDGYHASDFARLATSPTFTGSVTAGGDLVGARLRIGASHNLLGTYASIAGGSGNAVYTSSYACIGGGENNWIRSSADHSTIAGGEQNVIGDLAYQATIGGGAGNEVYSSRAVIAGGVANTNSAAYAGILGGYVNGIFSGGSFSTIGGGVYNVISAPYACIPGGFDNRVTGAYSFAGGRRAKADHPGSFVWGDSSDAEVGTWQNNQFMVRASGGVRFFTNPGSTTGSYLDPSGSSWHAVCDRNVKKNFRPVDSRETLAKLMTVPVTWWNYKAEPDDAVPHLGPMAQDFIGTFYPGDDDKGIDTLQLDGVALAAIQGLNEKLQATTEKLEKQNAELKARLEKLEQVLNERNGGVR